MTAGGLVAALLLACGAASASERGGAFAVRGGSARAALFGEAHGAVGGDADVANWNPATLVLLPRAQAQASYHDVYGLGLARYTSLDLAWRRGSSSVSVDDARIRVAETIDAGAAIAVGLQVLGVDVDPETYVEYEPSVSVAAPIAGGGSLGVSARYLRASSGISGVRATGYAFDLGVLQTLGPFRASVAFYNVLGRLSWKEGQEEDRPREAAWALAFTQGTVIVAGSVTTDLNERFVDRYTGALEAMPLPGRWGIGAGWRARRTGDTFEGRPAFGTWLQVERLRFDYAFEPAAYTPGDTHRITLSAGL